MWNEITMPHSSCNPPRSRTRGNCSISPYSQDLVRHLALAGGSLERGTGPLTVALRWVVQRCEHWRLGSSPSLLLNSSPGGAGRNLEGFAADGAFEHTRIIGRRYAICLASAEKVDHKEGLLPVKNICRLTGNVPRSCKQWFEA